MLRPTQSLGDQVVSVYCGCTNNSGAPIAITAAGTGDNTAVTGATIDRMTHKMPDSCVFSIAWLAALTAAKTLSLAAELQESADGSSWDTAEALQAATVVATGAGNKEGKTEFDVNLAGRKRYIRFNFTPDLSHTSTDTAIATGTAFFGGAQQVSI